MIKSKLSSRERLLTTIQHKESDYVPLNIDVHPSFVVHENFPWKDQFEVTDALLELETDPFISIWLPDPMPHPDVKISEWKEKNSEGGYPLLYKEYQTPMGKLRQVIRETTDFYSWHRINRNTVGNMADYISGVGLLEDVNPSRSVEFLIDGPEDLDKMSYLFQPISDGFLQKWREEAQFAKKEAEKRRVMLWGRRTYCGSAALWLCNTEKFIYTLSDNTEFIQRFLRIIQNWQNKMLEILLDAGVDIVTRFGYYDTPDFWGVNYFEKYLVPLLKEESKIVHEGGAFYCQQQSKGLTQYIDILKNIEIDILRDVDPVQGGENLTLLKKELGTTKTIWGGINGDVMLVHATKEEIRKTVSDTIKLMAPGGGFVMGVTPALYAGVSWEKVLDLIDAWKEFRELK